MALPPREQTPQDASQDAAAMAAAAMGIAPEQQAQGQQPAADAPPKDSQQDKAQSKGSPETEGDKQAADPVIYELEFGEGRKRAFTPDQLKGTLERYSALNYRNAQMKPVLDLVENIMRDNPGMNPKQLADKMDEVYKAGEHNTQMGKGAQQGQDPAARGQATSGDAENQEDLSSQLKKWSEDNAVALPPGYEQLMQGGPAMQQMQSQMQQMQQMLQAVLGQAAGTADAAKQGMQQAQGQQTQAIQRTIANNIDRVQQALKIPDDKANDFMVFAAERGYTLEDFVDPSLTIKVMQDFRNQMDSPEMSRMRDMAQRRQAYTGSMGAAPGASGAPPAASEMGATFDEFAAGAMAKRGIG